MAIIWRVKAGVTVDYGEGPELELPVPTQGTVRGVVRLWYEQPSPPAAPGVPASPSNKWLVIGDDLGPTTGPVAQRYGQAVTAADLNRFGGWQQLLTERGLSLDDYINNRQFSAALALPAAMIDSYTG